MASSLAQLVKMGLLEDDFLELDNGQVQVQVQGQVQGQVQIRAEGNGLGLGNRHVGQSRVHRNETDRYQTLTDATVEYVDRNLDVSTDQDRDQSQPQPSVQDDLQYYQDVGYHWLYSSPSYGWWHFAKDENEILEKMYHDNQTQNSLVIANYTYTIDFDKMLQKGAGRPRHLLRMTSLEDIVLKGVAGSRLNKSDILNLNMNKAAPASASARSMTPVMQMSQV